MEVTEDFVQKQFQNSRQGLNLDLSKSRMSTLQEGRGSRYKCWRCLAVIRQRNAAGEGACCRDGGTSGIDFVPPSFALEDKRHLWAVASCGSNELFLRVTEA